MRRVCTGSQLAAPATPNVAIGTPGHFNTEAPGVGVTPTVPGPDWFETVQEELAAILTAADISLDATGSSNAQVVAAIVALIAINGLGGTAQSWQNLSASRVLGANYTNSTPRPIFIAISGTSTATSNIGIAANGSVVSVGSAGSQGETLGASAIVPPGATYSFAVSAGTGTLVTCWELR